MDSARPPLAFLSLAFALLLSCAVCVESRYHGRNQYRMANDGRRMWCIAKPSTEAGTLFRNIDFSCGQSGVDCTPIQPGGSCFNPDTPVSHASYAMNLFYKFAGKHPWDCNFNGTGVTVPQNPCKFHLKGFFFFFLSNFN
ncbi:major pollen allergen Ole e 10 isoform X1 [Manihot esculenta]|uniref:major pollen allergen Ole e 10 isoform X1 n=1 Tax=Manihot esculenta TaxID=3983 RepID=UPI000B5D5E30|nr:major pollen allergen Ole e 10 isoform X1 [Manihot esculenta]